MSVCVFLIVAHGGADPVVVAAHTGINTGVSLHGTVITPGHDTLQLTITHQGATRVSLQTQAEVEGRYCQFLSLLSLQGLYQSVTEEPDQKAVLGCPL